MDTPKDKQGAFGGSLKSYVRMGLAPKPANEEEAKNLKPVPVNIEFESTAISIGDKKYLYLVSWWDRDKRPHGEIVKVIWPKGSVVDEAFRTPGTPVYVSDQVIQVAASPNGARYETNAPPRYEVVTVRFVNADNKEIGTASVATYTPSR